MLKEHLDNLLTSINLRRYGQRVNWWNTFWFNFRAFPFAVARRFPVHVVGGIRLIRVGDIILPKSIRGGMVVIGEDFYKSTRKTQFINWGTITFQGPCKLRAGLHLTNSGRITIGEDVEISENSSLNIADYLVIGDKTSVGYASSFTDSDDHYSINMADRTVHNNCKGIKLGKGCWLGNNTFVKKGAVLPDYTMVASANSLVAKDYSALLKPYSIIGGVPAKLIKQGYRRILNGRSEQQMRTFFENEKDGVFKLDEETNIEDFC